MTEHVGTWGREQASATRRQLCLSAGLAAVLWGSSQAIAAAPARLCSAPAWPLWQAFTTHFIQADGRVLDASTPQKQSTSEGQSYGMFFALVANDRARFELMWRWSISNLFGGTLPGRLPAWLWGQATDGAWRVLDPNSASDADLWFVYALSEAARLWDHPAYLRDARTLLATIESLEVSEVPDLGTMLRPGNIGFLQDGGRQWQFNPSYLPVPVLRRLAVLSPRGPWGRIADNTAHVVRQAGKPHGVVPDWVAYAVDAQGAWGFVPHPGKGSIGSYDAIRSYLWAGMTPFADPLAARMMQSLHGLAAIHARTGILPESVDAVTGEAKGIAPFGFSAALLPYLETAGAPAQRVQDRRRHVERELVRVLTEPAVAAKQPPYYDIVLSLFGMGWLDRHYRFSRTGELAPRWTSECKTSTS
jgi:endo-1,4-beta-D-glucanase Y